MLGGLHAHAHVDSSLLQIPIKSLCFTIAVVQFLFTILTSLFHPKMQSSESSGDNLRL
jgi:hypothetical protein